MILIILGIILSLIIFVLLGVNITQVETRYGKTDKAEWKMNKKQLFAPIGLIVILFGCFVMVPANSVGIKYNPFNGGTQEKTVGEGFYVKSPLEKIYKLSTKVQEFQFQNISIQTKDAQYVTTILQVQARIDKAKAYEYFKKYGNKKLTDIQSILSNTVQKQFEKITTTYNVMEVLGEKRNEIVDKTLANVKEELLKDGILIERIVLVDSDAGAEVEKAISNEAIAKKEVETAEYKKQKAEIEGESKVIEAQKEKEANELLNQTLTDEILTQQFIERWNGELPVVTGNDNMMDITGLLK